MRLLQGVLPVAIAACITATYQQTLTSALRPPPTTLTPPGSQQAPESPAQEVNNRYVKQLSERIAGREREPARQVFRNIKLPWLKNVPAGQLISIMNDGYSRALGVACTHCHVEQDFASDNKRPKLAAREMAVMHRMINEQLGKMQNLEGKPEDRFINCTTCHRGAIDPRLAGR